MFQKYAFCVGQNAVICLCGLAVFVSPQSLQAEGLPKETVELLIAGQWEQVFDQLKDVEPNKADGVSRLVAVHASLQTNRNNLALLLILSLEPRHIDKWAEWTGSLAKANEVNAVACYLRGDALARCGKLAEAETWFTRAIPLDGKFAMPWIGRGMVRAMRIPENSEYRNSAYDDFDRATQVNPNLAEAHASKGCYEILLTNADGAVMAFDQALVCNSNFALALNGRGCAYYGLGKRGKASHDFGRAEKLLTELAGTTAANRTSLEALVSQEVRAKLHHLKKLGMVANDEMLTEENLLPPTSPLEQEMMEQGRAYETLKAMDLLPPGGVLQSYSGTVVDTGEWPVSTFFTLAYGKKLGRQESDKVTEAPASAQPVPVNSTVK